MLFREAALPLEVVILMIGGMALLIAGILLFLVSAARLPYYENGLYGVLLVVFALQIIMLGKTPFGDIPRSRWSIASGVVIAAVGISACFVPTFTVFPQVLLAVSFGPGGLFLLFHMVFSKGKLPTWLRHRGVLLRLIPACFGVYLLSIFVAVLLVTQGLAARPVTAAAILVYGVAVLFLAAVLKTVYRTYPEAETGAGDGGLSADQAMLLLMGVFMVLLGILLVPVSAGLLPFSGHAQLGLLMVIFAVQMLAAGNTPIGPFPRSWAMIGAGLVFAALGIVSSIVPEILVGLLTVLVGLLNILGGLVAVVKISTPYFKRGEQRREWASPLAAKLFAAQVTMNLLTILFGISMLIPGLFHGILIGVILAVNGSVLLYLLHILVVLDMMQRGAAAPV